MTKMASPEELHEYLINLPEDKLKELSQNVKDHLKSIKLINVFPENIDQNVLSKNLEEFTIENGLNFKSTSNGYIFSNSDSYFNIEFIENAMIIDWQTATHQNELIVNVYDSFNQNNIDTEIYEFIISKYDGIEY